MLVCTEFRVIWQIITFCKEVDICHTHKFRQTVIGQTVKQETVM